MIDDEVLPVAFPHLDDVAVDVICLRGRVVQIVGHTVLPRRVVRTVGCCRGGSTVSMCGGWPMSQWAGERSRSS